jgi:hypothetical protein
MNRHKLYLKALHKWGPSRQFYILIEECAEVQKEVTKILRGENFETEFAKKLFLEIVDLEIMIEKMKVYYNHKGQYDKMMKKHKLEKLKLIEEKLKK